MLSPIKSTRTTTLLSMFQPDTTGLLNFISDTSKTMISPLICGQSAALLLSSSIKKSSLKLIVIKSISRAALSLWVCQAKKFNSRLLRKIIYCIWRKTKTNFKKKIWEIWFQMLLMMQSIWWKNSSLTTQNKDWLLYRFSSIHFSKNFTTLRPMILKLVHQ